MSLLAPLYFAGALAIGLPILFHLIRRQPRGEVQFSSLIFLRPTPPRLTRRSRLDNWPLLLLRALALLLLAAAFTRPFLRSISMSESDLPSRRWVIAVDTSASMRRDGLWDRAKSQVDEILSDLRAGDELAVIAFDNEAKTLLPFEQSNRLTVPQIQSSIQSMLSEITPSWAATDLGRAISYAADLAVTFETDSNQSSEESSSDSAILRTKPAHLILITDMQAGSQIESLQVYAWPDELTLDVRRVLTDKTTNASAQLLPARANANDDKDRVRVRVSNSADADRSSFRLAWSDADGRPIEATGMPIQVPAGESRVVKMPALTPKVTSLVLRGDDHDFDNRWYVVSPQPESLTLLHLGNEAPDPRDSLFYYLQRVPLDTIRRTVAIKTIIPDQLKEVPRPEEFPLVVVTESCSADTAKVLRDYVTAGGQLLYVLADERTINQSEATLRVLSDTVQLSVTEAVVDDYVMLSRIDFRHPLFVSMADPQFNDFTKIRFWSHRTITELPDSWGVLARFDDESPALVEQSIGDGKLWVLAAGWQPTASQLALSTKFLPLIFGMFDSGTGSDANGDQRTVGDKISLTPSSTAELTLPDGAKIAVASVSDYPTLKTPGIFSISYEDSNSLIAVNLDDSESRTETIQDDDLERFGVQLGTTLSAAEALTNQRQLRDRELESRQRLWQWLLVAALVLLGMETFLGGWLSKSRSSQQEAKLA